SMCRLSGSAEAPGSCRSIRCHCRARPGEELSRFKFQAAVDETSRSIMRVLISFGLVALIAHNIGAAAHAPALAEAARRGDRAAVRALLQKGADVNAAEADGTTALHWASYADDVDLADLL